MQTDDDRSPEQIASTIRRLVTQEVMDSSPPELHEALHVLRHLYPSQPEPALYCHRRLIGLARKDLAGAGITSTYFALITPLWNYLEHYRTWDYETGEWVEREVLRPRLCIA